MSFTNDWALKDNFLNRSKNSKDIKKTKRNNEEETLSAKKVKRYTGRIQKQLKKNRKQALKKLSVSRIDWKLAKFRKSLPVYASRSAKKIPKVKAIEQNIGDNNNCQKKNLIKDQREKQKNHSG